MHFMADLAVVDALSGNLVEAEKILDQLTELSKHLYVSPYRMAQIYVALGDKDRAFEWLEKGNPEMSFCESVLGPKASPFWDQVRSDPRFADLLRRMNLLS